MQEILVVGEKDSGKTSWARIFFGLIRRTKIAVLTKERLFGATMMTRNYCIEMSGLGTICADMAKTIFQGGYFATVVNHQHPKTSE